MLLLPSICDLVNLISGPGLLFNGRKDENGKTIDRGAVGIRGAAAAEKILETVRQLQEARDVKQ